MTNPGDPHWHSRTEAPLRVSNADTFDWDDEADVIVVGFGGAGVCAALTAREAGADVLAIDRFAGGGATALSGGVYYGGATRFQREAGFEDTPEQMFNYLKQEAAGVVKDSTLKRFCDESSDNLEWLIRNGVDFSSAFTPVKTSYPGPGEYLYFSGNEKILSYAAHAAPAPRGHRAVGEGFGGQYFFGGLKDSALQKGVRLMSHSPVMRLVTDEDGSVVGVEVNSLPRESAARQEHLRDILRFNGFFRYLPGMADKLKRRIESAEERAGVRKVIRARNGVILSTGGFAFNREMIGHHAPAYKDVMPLGSLGCDGSGVRLGESVRGDTGHMERVSPWRIIAPPNTYLKGMVVNLAGERFIPEDIYCGTLGFYIGSQRDGRAWLILDKALFRQALRELNPLQGMTLSLPLLSSFKHHISNSVKGRTIKELAGKCGIAAGPLEATLADYNRIGSGEIDDPQGKSPDFQHVLEGPFYALDISVGNKQFPCPSISLGGLRVVEESGQVVSDDNEPVSGLYAAGRTAVGICSQFYVSGTSIADCVFSGRRAGANATGNRPAA